MGTSSRSSTPSTASSASRVTMLLESLSRPPVTSGPCPSPTSRTPRPPLPPAPQPVAAPQLEPLPAPSRETYLLPEWPEGRPLRQQRRSHPQSEGLWPHRWQQIQALPGISLRLYSGDRHQNRDC